MESLTYRHNGETDDGNRKCGNERFHFYKVLFAQRHRMKLWIAHGERRLLFILICTV